MRALFPEHFGQLPAPRPALIGMVHLQPLPGSPRWAGDMAAVLAHARRDAEALLEGGCDALIVENMGDLPYLRGHVAPETVAAAALATAAVVALGAPTGVQLLAGANHEALAVAVAAGARFIRAEAFAYAHVADEGWLDASAGPLLRTRRALGAEVAIWADVQKKHAAHAVTADLSLADLAKGAAFSGADALIVTGSETGAPTDPEAARAVRVAGLPVLIGSGVDLDNIAALAAVADGLIVGSALKHGGDWRNPVDPVRVARLRAALEG
ncbi:BtpA/SgcQ family protein [Myxococcota bacterium]|nr:BtpA/SgcQ family protein [Myxococcota bacterium]MBU1430744.1 BtpA/SgcQ family protein [Myxococcota bacterium]MBU1897146.1 BtpA/SgcQ family protein [Myxococcota bacterium]